MPDAKLPREIHFKADKGEIDVFLCPDDSYQQTNGDPLLDDIRPYVTPIVEKYLSPQKINGKPSTYPLRTAQRNLNKILLGANDSNDDDDDNKSTISSITSNETIKSSTKSISTPKQIELDNLIENIFNPMASTSSFEQTKQSTSSSISSSSIQQTNSNNLKSEFVEYGDDCYHSMSSMNATTNALNHHQQQSISNHSNHATHTHHQQTIGDVHMDLTASLMNNNVKPSKGVRNALMSEMVEFNPLNNIMTQSDSSVNGEFIFFFQFFYSFLLNHLHVKTLTKKTKMEMNETNEERNKPKHKFNFMFFFFFFISSQIFQRDLWQ